MRKLVTQFLLLITLAAPAAYAENEILTGLQGSFDVPIGDLLVKKHDSEFRNLFSGLSVGVVYNYPASLVESDLGSGDDGSRQTSTPTLGLTWKYTLVGAWFVGGSFSYYKDLEKRQPWNPDFTYCFGYNDWRPYTLSLTYCNYGGNRLEPEDGQRHTDFDGGGWTLGYKFPLAKRLQHLLLMDPNGSIGCNVGLSYVHKYTDAATNSELTGKKRASFGCKYTIWKNWYWNFAINYYPDKSQQQPWDPDYTYGFGYFDWRPGTISFQYNNYSGNRFNSADRADGTGRFRNGTFSISYSRSF